MLIGGIQKLSLIDYPKKLAAVAFTQGCPFRCHFCHNPSLVLPECFNVLIDEKEFFSFLKTRKGKLDGVVVTGGEPTLHHDLLPFIQNIKLMGFLIKLDTSGIFPDRLEQLIKHQVIDYIAMDIKAPLEKYASVTQRHTPPNIIEKSISLIMNSAIDYEFRTTIVDRLHTQEDIRQILQQIRGAKKYVLQRFRAGNTLSSDYQQAGTLSQESFETLLGIAQQYVKQCIVR